MAPSGRSFHCHFQPREAQKINRIGQLRQGVLKAIEDENYSPDVSRKYVAADRSLDMVLQNLLNIIMTYMVVI